MFTNEEKKTTCFLQWLKNKSKISDKHFVTEIKFCNDFCCLVMIFPPSDFVVVVVFALFLFAVGCCIVQELCESRGGRPGLSVLTSLLVSVDVKNY